jgi:hypothetical protein
VRAALVALLLAGLVATPRTSAAQQRVHTYGGPSFIASAYSNDDAYINNEEAPNLRARLGAAIDLTNQLDVVGPFLVQPKLAFVWMARRWPVGADSSPIGENNEYRPELLIDLTPGSDWQWLGVSLKEIRLSPWAHASNGQAADQYSASMDMLKLAPVFEWRGWQVLVEGWYLYGLGSETAGIVDYANFAGWIEAGGAVEVERTVKLGADLVGADGTVLREAQSVWFKVRLTLTSQDVEAVIPLADYFNVGAYVWAHNGELDGIVDYASNHFVGGVGMAMSLE